MVAKKKAADTEDKTLVSQNEDETKVIDLTDEESATAPDETVAETPDETTVVAAPDETAVVASDETKVVATPDETTTVATSDETTVVNSDETSVMGEDFTNKIAALDETLPTVPALDATAEAPMPQDLETINTETFASDQQGKKKRHGLKIFGRIVLGLIILAGLAYIGGAVAFNFYAMPNTTIGGKDVSLQPLSDIASAQEKKVDAYETTVSGFGFTYTIKASDISISFDKNTYSKGLAVKQDAWLWPLHIFESHTLSATDGFSYSSSGLKKAITAAVEDYNKGATQPTDAFVAYDEAKGAFAVTPEKVGTALDATVVYTFIKDQISSMPSEIKLDETCLLQPSVTSDDEKLVTAVENANTYLSADIPLTLNGMDAGRVTKAQIAEFIVINDDQTASLDEEKLKEWIKTNIAAKFDTLSAKRVYTRPDGKVITVESSSSDWGSYYGWLTDEASLTTQLLEAIKSGSTATIDVPTKQTAKQVPDENGRDWGNRYIDCDLTEQHVRLYDDSGSVVWESDCVTGGTNDNHDTPTGVFFLNSNRATGDVELRGKIDPATNEPEYISHVKYWMPFIANSVAFHDASWRSSFGGNIYTYAGSHGCVNLPSAKAQELYNLCKVGDVVVVHW